MNQQKPVKSPVPPPPSVDDFAPHRPLKGVRRLVALAAIKRVPQFAAVSVVGLGVLAGAMTLERSGKVSGEEAKVAVAPAATETEVEISDVAHEPPPLAVPVTVVKTVPLPSVVAPKEESAAPDVAATAKEPLIEKQADAPLPAVPGVTADMNAVDIGEIAAAVDTLGIRADSIETALGEAKPDVVAKPEISVAAAISDTPKALELSAEDAKVRGRLEARLKEFTAKGDKTGSKAAKAELDMFDATLSTLIEFKIVDRKGEKPGFWRSLVDDPKTKQFFVVVEAVVDGEPVNWAVRDADSGKIVSGAKFALQVDEKTFAELSADKKDDGRIANMVVGLKPVGRITPVWSIKTDGETITGF
ncbi:DUF6384 family protein [Rhizobium sp. BK176]|uniref:DUF6384 family protein n=1 Tax=Rhizobium sp. BK176 TaxID=2587071 RepID=UPI002168F853|nr:DUF6384 family protein [Rhizobium sp. BK176]MCS4089921.1 hypothetical protein [Rhizobium sp. BK176]